MSRTVEIAEMVKAARDHRTCWEAMAVTLECGHMRLMPKQDTSLGIGALVGCKICAESHGRLADVAGVHWPARVVCKVEGTGTLHEDYLKA